MKEKTPAIEKTIEIEVYRTHLHLIWFSLKFAIDKGFPANPQDEAFLLETMTDVAKQDKNTSDAFKMRLSWQKWYGVWNCLNMMIQNQFITEMTKITATSQTMLLIAQALDAGKTMDIPPGEIPQVEFNVRATKQSKTLLVVD